MGNNDRRRSHRTNDKNRPAAGIKAAADRPFDRWLQKQLHAMYDEIASEPLPNDLLNVIDKDAANSTTGKQRSPRPFSTKNK